MHSTLPRYDIVLVGAGHTNAHVLRMWRMSPLADCRLTCITNYPLATYSGMLPGTLAGLYQPERMQIDLVRLCAASGARLLVGEVTGLDLARKQVLMSDRPPVPFDVLSIGIGSAPKLPPSLKAHARVVTIKPMQTFLGRLEQGLARLQANSPNRPWRIAIVGAGAGGVEIAFCLPAYLREHYPGCHHELTVVDSGDEILPGANRGMIRLARGELARRGVELVLGQVAQNNDDGHLILEGRKLPMDLVIWATSAVAPPLLSQLGLPTDDKGFVQTRATLQTVAGAPVFVVGDSGTSIDHPTPKAGVFAVRQGPVLWENLQRQLRGEDLLPYVPQRGFLKLLATGDGRAILGYKGLSFHAAWCWTLKSYIDNRFISKYQDYLPPSMMPMDNGSATAMQCAGCGGKLASGVLSRALSRLNILPDARVSIGLDRPDDAAIVQVGSNGRVAASVDFFAPFVDDPYFVGRVAALNAANDLFAIGSRPAAALALAAVEPGPQNQQEQYLYELLAGSVAEFDKMGVSLVGGHTIESSRPLIGFSLFSAAGDPPRVKGGLRSGEYLVLTKPLGSGILLAAHMRAKCRSEWFESLRRVLLTSNQYAAQCAQEMDIQGITDVTGFGLAGHLFEMLRASGVSAEVWLDRIPLLPGVSELLADGIESSLAPANRAVECDIDFLDEFRSLASYAAQFDPQTCGGLLLGVPAERLDGCLQRLGEGGAEGYVIGRVNGISAVPKLRIVRRAQGPGTAL